MILILSFSLSACQKEEFEYPCNEVDQVFVPFFGDVLDTYNGIEIGKLNQCNEEIDTLEDSKTMISNLLANLEEKNNSINPDISALAAYYDYDSNSRLYPEDLVSYDFLDSYLGTMELTFIYDAILQIESFNLYYDDPLEGQVNEFIHHDEFYKLRYYVNEGYIYYVQYHNEGASQFTVVRITIDDNDSLIYDILTYYGDDANYTYKYTAYQEGVFGIQAKYREYEPLRGILEVKELDLREQILKEYSLSNYASELLKISWVSSEGISRYTKENDGFYLEVEKYLDYGFESGYIKDTREGKNIFDLKYNLQNLYGWDYYFQEGLYKDDQLIDIGGNEVFENSVIERDEFLIINQHFEFYVGDEYPYGIGLDPIKSSTGGLFDYQHDTEILDTHFENLLDDHDLTEIKLIDVWKSLVPNDFYEFIRKNR